MSKYLDELEQVLPKIEGVSVESVSLATNTLRLDSGREIICKSVQTLNRQTSFNVSTMSGSFQVAGQQPLQLEIVTSDPRAKDLVHEITARTADQVGAPFSDCQDALLQIGETTFVLGGVHLQDFMQYPDLEIDAPLSSKIVISFYSWNQRKYVI